MIKTIKIGEKEVTLDNSIVWALKYRNQFGKDIIQTIMPAFASAFDIISGALENGEPGKDTIDLRDIFKAIDGEHFLNAVIHMGELELNDFLCVVWALAKTADESIPEPEKWLRQFDTFWLDEVVPEVIMLIAQGVVSAKKLEWLSDLKKKVQPISDSTTSFSPQPKEG